MTWEEDEDILQEQILKGKEAIEEGRNENEFRKKVRL